MSIVGRLEDVPVIDVLSMLHLSGRSGALSLDSVQGAAHFVFRQGAITSASCPSLGRTIGQVLAERAGVSDATVAHALELQRERKLPLGQILVDMRAITQPKLHEALIVLIGEVVRETIRWRAGSFRFEVRSDPALDDVAFVPDEVSLESALGIKELLTDASRVFDQHSRQLLIPAAPAVTQVVATKASEPPRSSEPEPARGAKPTALAASSEADSTANLTLCCVVLISDDGIVANTLRVSWAEQGIQTRSYALEQEAARQIAELLSAGADVVAVLHTDAMAAGADARGAVALARRFKAAFPHVPLVTAGSSDAGTRYELLRHGVRAVVALPTRAKEPRGFRSALTLACTELSAIVAGAFLELRGTNSFVDGSSRDLKRLAERVEGLHRSTENAAVALSLFEYVAENVERSVLFLCRRSDLIAVSAFGTTPDGQDMAHVTPGLSLRLEDAETLRRVIEDGRSHRGAVSAEGADCPSLFRRIGRPRSGAVLWIPVRSLDRVFALLYADNGARMRPLVSTEALQILACQAGLLLENIALKRRAQRSLEARPDSAA